VLEAKYIAEGSQIVDAGPAAILEFPRKRKCCRRGSLPEYLEPAEDDALIKAAPQGPIALGPASTRIGVRYLMS